jgi:hypothetical protein
MDGYFARIVRQPDPVSIARPRWLLLLVVLSLAGSARASESPPAVHDAAVGFYRAVLAGSHRGVPSSKDRGRLAPHLTPALAELLGRADATERDYRDATHGEVPPLVEGDLFSSLFEGPTGFEVTACAATETGASCDVELRYEPPGDAEKTHWRDRVLLVKSDRGWLVDDVAYGGEWEFMHKGTLRSVLASAIRDGSEAAAAARKERLLLGGWIHAKGETEFEQMEFAIEDGKYVFRSWLHERPEIVGEWSRDGDAVTVRGPDGSTWKLAITKLDKSSLEVRFDGNKGRAVFRRPTKTRPRARSRGSS